MIIIRVNVSNTSLHSHWLATGILAAALHNRQDAIYILISLVWNDLKLSSSYNCIPYTGNYALPQVDCV